VSPRVGTNPNGAKAPPRNWQTNTCAETATRAPDDPTVRGLSGSRVVTLTQRARRATRGCGERRAESINRQERQERQGKRRLGAPRKTHALACFRDHRPPGSVQRGVVVEPEPEPEPEPERVCRVQSECGTRKGKSDCAHRARFVPSHESTSEPEPEPEPEPERVRRGQSVCGTWKSESDARERRAESGREGRLRHRARSFLHMIRRPTTARRALLPFPLGEGVGGWGGELAREARAGITHAR
jgi:hypothetical protein